MNELQIFNNPEFGEIRTIEINGKSYFMASDIARALGYARPNDAVQAHCRATVKHSTPISGKMQEVNYIPEGDVYRLIASSKLPGADKFESWIFDEVLPSIRKHGVYAIDEVLQNPDMLISALQNLKEERAKRQELESELKHMDAVISDMTPKVDYVDRILSSNDCMTTTQIAQDYGMSAKAFNHLLHNFGIQRNVSGQWILYHEYQGKGYVKTRTHEYPKANGTTGTKTSTVWTQKGRMFLYEKLKAQGIEPTEV